MEDLISELQERRREAKAMGGPERVAQHHAQGRLTVRERIELLLDEESFFEIGLLAKPELREHGPVPADAAITGFGTIDERVVGVIGIDSTVKAGTTAPIGMRKQGHLIEFAERKGIPIIVLADADGGRIPDVMGWRFSGLPFDFATFLQAPDHLPPVPRLCAVLGPSYGDAGLHAAHSHIVVMTKRASIGLSGPSVVAAAVGESVTDEDLAGPGVATRVGTAHLVVEDEETALGVLRAYLSYLPDHAGVPAQVFASVPPDRPADSVLELVATDPRRGYDMLEVLETVVDGNSLLPWRPEGARSLLTTFARLEGHPVGLVANQPLHQAGVLTSEALDKEYDFVDLCDTFSLPLLFFHDVPGLMVGSDAERQGILARYERVAARLARTRVPLVGVVIRKAYGGGHYAMGGRPTRPDFLFAWPTAELGFMAPETGIRTLHRRRLEAARDAGHEDELFEQLLTEWRVEAEPWEAAAHLSLDDVIDPRQTRTVLAGALQLARGNRS